MYLTAPQITQLGFKHVGVAVRISDKASFYNAPNISISDGVRIDDYTIFSAGMGGIEIGKLVHVGCFTSLIGAGKIIIGDYTELSGRVSIYSSTNNFDSDSFFIDGNRINIIEGDVKIGNRVVVGCSSIVLPNVSIGFGSRVGALSLVKNNIQHKQLWAGVPAKKIRDL